MKKIISLGLASAVCALTAVAASADVVNYTAEGAAVTGETITVTLTAGQALEVPAFSIAVEGFEIVGDVKGAGALSTWNADTKTFVALDTPAAGATIATVTLKVTAEAGKTATMTLTNKADQAVTYEAFSLPIGAASTPSESTPSESKPAESTPSESKPADDTTNPGTGVALAVVPAVLAAAGVVVAKKRK